MGNIDTSTRNNFDISFEMLNWQIIIRASKIQQKKK